MTKIGTIGSAPSKLADRGGRLPVRWDELPHDALWKKVLCAMELGSRARSSEDALRYILKRRLPTLDSADHLRYVELECQRIVELLRVVRDQYRTYLKNLGCKPIAQMYWVVFRFAVIQYALRVLRTAASDYVTNSQIHSEDWHLLFGYSSPTVVIPMGTSPSRRRSVEDKSRGAVKDTISGLVREKAFWQRMAGGPFGKDGQTLIARRNLDMDSKLSITEDIKLRHELWDKCRPWTDGLATMFDVSRQELIFQVESLPEDGQRAESVFLSLTELESMAYQHIVGIGRHRTARKLSEEAWKNLFRELDDKNISPKSALTGRAKEIWGLIRKKGHEVDTWSQCYDRKLRVSLDSGKTYALRREVTHFLHNAAKNAKSQLAKVR